MAVCGLGWLVWIGAVLAPLIGAAMALSDTCVIATDVVGTPRPLILAQRSLTLSATAAVVALLMGILPAAVLGSCSRRVRPWLLGLILAPLIVPPQIYAYAWGLLPAAGIPALRSVGAWSTASKDWVGGSVRAGIISAGWLWPVVALILAAGWRSMGRAAYRLALLDASPLTAFIRVVLPSLRAHIAAAITLVVGITLLEYPIPHLSLCRVWATELMVLVEVGASNGQLLRMAAQPVAVMAVLIGLAAWIVRATGTWQPISDEEQYLASEPEYSRNRLGRLGWAAWLGTAAVWWASVGVPVVLMVRNLRVPGAWMQGLRLFSEQWFNSLQVCLAAGVLAIVLAIATVVWPLAAGRGGGRRWAGLASGWGVVGVIALVPPAVLGMGLIAVFNRGDVIRDLYTQTPVVWILGMVGRYGVIAVLVAWLSVGRRNIVAVDQARVDGATGIDVLIHVMLPLIWPSLMAAGLVVAALSVFEVVVTQMVAPPAFGSIAMTILNYMHYGRDDAVITSSLTLMVAGVLLTQVCGHVWVRRSPR